MNVEQLPINDVIPYENNPRKNKQAIDKVADSLREYGWRQPIVVDADNVVIVGHTRLLAAQKLGMDTVPVLTAADLTEEQAKAYRIADNRTGEEAEWDLDLLTIELRSLDDIGFQLDLTGFDSMEIDAMFNPSTRKGSTQDDDVPDDVEALSATGDVWQLGGHRLIVGDATDPAVLEALMGNRKAHMVWTDPPYNVAYVGKTKDRLEIDNDDMNEASFRELLHGALENALLHTVKGGGIYIAHADSGGHIFREEMLNAGWLMKQYLIWVKNHFVMGRHDYQWKHEPVLYGWKKGARHRWYGGFDKTTVINEDRPQRSSDHPTMKPVNLVARMVCNSSKRGDLVLDVFGGSGSTLIACEKHGRACRMVELDPHYADVIIRRWQDYTDEEAVKLEKVEAA